MIGFSSDVLSNR